MKIYVIHFVGQDRREVKQSKSRTPNKREQQIQDNFAAVPLDLLSKVLTSSFQVAEVCAKVVLKSCVQVLK